jgi:MFS transporter, DHA2 family, methylenomycin A resistance protein
MTAPALTIPLRRTLPMVIAATSMAFVMVRVDSSIVNVALAEMGTSLGVEVSGLQWVINAYTLAFASLLLSAGVLGDRIGVRRVFLGGLVLFTVASLTCACSMTAAALILSRAVQGVGAALMVPCSLALLNHACGDDQAARARAVGIWAAAGGVGVTTGPVLGGLMVSTLGWQSVFLINVPIGLLGIWLTLAFAERVDPAPGGRSLDLGGQVLAIVTLVAMTATVIETGSLGWAAPLVETSLALSVIAGAGFVLVERKTATPMVPLRLFRNATFSAATAIGFILSLTVFGAVFLLSLYLQQVLLYSPWETGMAFVPFGLTTIATNVVAGRLAAKIGVRPIINLGLLIAAAGYAFLHGIDGTTSYLSMLPAQLMIRVGVALTAPSLMTACLSSVDRTRSGMASGVLTMSREAGSAFGVALFGALMAQGTIPGIQHSMTVSGILLALGAVIAAAAMRRSPQ